MAIEFSEKALMDLEWDRIADALASHAMTLRGRSQCLNLRFFEQAEDARRELDLVSEFRSLMVEGEAPSLGGVSSGVADLVVKTQKEGVLNVPELCEVASTVEASNRVGQHLSRRKNVAPNLAGLSDGITQLPGLLEAIQYAIDRDSSEIRDRASKNLGPLRKKVRDLHNKIRHKLDEMLGSENMRPALRDSYFTIREERYVLPIKSAEKSAVEGIVHGASGSGQTIFVEPQELLSVNNALILAQMEVQREERQILRGLSKSVSNDGLVILANLTRLTQLDVIQAKARLAEQWNGERPRIVDEPMIKVLNGRHPLLFLKGVEVVNNDLTLGEDYNFLVLSGANTGGKTVALKMVGLMVLIAWTGIPIPASADSVIGRFERIFCVMGDEQSLSDDLSTFSANILRLNEVVRGCFERSLVLLDEIVVGTDPKQGAALAQSIVEAMADKGARGIVTTHYDRLKRLALARTDFMNAAVGLSEDLFRPTYKITTGIPGTSAAFRIAEKLGVSEEVVARAQSLVESEADEVDAMMRRLHEDVQRQQAEIERLKAAQQDVEVLQATYKRRLKLVESREREEALKRRTETAMEIRHAREKVKEVIRALQRGMTPAEASQASKDLQSIENDFAESDEPLISLEPSVGRKEEKSAPSSNEITLISPEEIRPGMVVWVTSLRQTGVVVESPDKRGLALVEVGRLKMRLPVDRLALKKDQSLKDTADGKSPLREALLKKTETANAGPGALNCDVRGERVEEALALVESFLDRAIRLNTPFVYIIHGHGTGRLKSALREQFRRSPYIQSFRPGERGEGQDGVTVVFLKNGG